MVRLLPGQAIIALEFDGALVAVGAGSVRVDDGLGMGSLL
jgi:hypothetical protein